MDTSRLNPGDRIEANVKGLPFIATVDNPEKGRLVQGGALRCVATQPLQEVRDQQAAKKHNRDLGGLIRQAIIDCLKTARECCADDLIPLYPQGEVDECRRLATAQFGSLASGGDGKHPLIREKSRRKSTIPARKGAKVTVWEFTKAGWDRYGGSAGVGTDRHAGFVRCPDRGMGIPVSADSGEIVGSNQDTEGSKTGGKPSTLDRPGGLSSLSSPSNGAGSGAGVPTDDGSEDCASPESDRSSEPARDPEPLSLLPQPDPDAWAA